MRPRPGTGSPKRKTSACSVWCTVNAEANATTKKTMSAAMAANAAAPFHLRSPSLPRGVKSAERQIGNDPLALPATLIDNDLVHAGEDTFHGFKIHSFPRHLGRFFILLIDLIEAGNLTGCLGDGLKPVAFGLLDDGRGLALGLGNDPVGIGLRLVAQTVLILLRRGHILKGGDDLLGRVDGLQLHLQHQDAGLIPIEDLLHEFLHVRLDLWAIGGQNSLYLPAADDFAHCALRDRLYGFALIGDIEGIILGMYGVDLPDDDKFDVGDIFIAGQDQAFFWQVERDLPIRCSLVLAEGETNISQDAVGDRELLHSPDGDRQIVVQPRTGLARVAAENPVQADFVRADRVKPGQKPDDRADESQGKNAAASHAPRSRHPLFEPLLRAPEELLEFRWRRARLLPPRPGAAGLPRAAISAFIAPRHEILF